MAGEAADATPAEASPELQQPQEQQEEEEQKEQEQEQGAEQGAEQPSGFVGETQTQSQPWEADSQSQEETKETPTGEQVETEEQSTEEQEEVKEQPLERADEQEQAAAQEEKQAERPDAQAPRFEAPSPPREQQKEPEPARMSAPPPPPPRSSRYSYAELKQAQRRCEDKMVETALLECRDASRAQQEIFRAHVTDLCANIFAAALRKYNPESKEDVEPVDPVIAAKVAEMERRLKAKEAAVGELRKQVPRMAAMNTRQQLASERKRNSDVLVTAPEEADEVEMTDVDVEAMRDAFVKTSTTIANANVKLSQVISQTTETIHVVEQAMKRPKTSMDKAMEHSPLKSTVLLTDQEMASDEHPSSLRTRLAMHFSASKSV